MHFQAIRDLSTLCGVAGGILALCAPSALSGQHDPIAIGVIQGRVGESVDPKHASSFENDRVLVQGVVHQLLLRQRKDGGVDRGFFIQNTSETADGDPFTSDALFVFHRKNAGIPDGVDRTYIPAIGDEIVLTGKIKEQFFATELSSARLVKVVRTGINLDEALPVIPVPVLNSKMEARRFHESHESMRVLLPAGSMVQGGRKVFGENANAEVWFITPPAPTLVRDNEFARRVFRDAHPLDDIPGRSDNENAHLIAVGSLGLKGNLGEAAALIEPLRTFDVLKEPLAGAMHQRYESYVIQVASQPVSLRGSDPSLNGRAKRADSSTHFTVATFNVENLFDLRNDPDDLCDFETDPGNDSVSRPFNYLPETDAAYREKLRELGLQIVEGMNQPDLILIQEVEDQDILSLRADGKISKRESDGELDALQELCATIRELGGGAFGSTGDRDAAGYRGIACGFLYRLDRVELIDTMNRHSLFGKNPGVTYRGAAHPGNSDISNPKAFNATLPADVDASTGISTTNVFPRAALVGQFRMKNGTGEPSADAELFVINNHFSSRPHRRVGQRREQALYNRRIVEALLAGNPDALILAGGDLNVFPRPDEPIQDSETDQLAHLYEAGLFNVHDEMLKINPAGAYTYVYKGQAGTLDHLFLSPSLHRLLEHVWVGHFNSDWPDSNAADSPFGASDHDPVLASFRFKNEGGSMP